MGGSHASQWLRVPAGAAATLSRIEPLIPGSAEVIVSQGVVGRFADRTDVRILLGPGYQPVSRKDVWFVVLPTYGVETQSTGSAMATVAELAGPLHATDGHPRQRGLGIPTDIRRTGVTRVQVPGLAPIPAWTTPGAGAARCSTASSASGM